MTTLVYFDPLTFPAEESSESVTLTLKTSSPLPEATTIQFTFTSGTASSKGMLAAR